MSLRTIRLSHGYTVGDVAVFCNVSPKTIRRYENNGSKLPLHLIIQLSFLYNVTPNSLVG